MVRYCCHCKRGRDSRLMLRVPKDPETLRKWKLILGEDFIKVTTYVNPYICQSHFPTEEEKPAEFPCNPITDYIALFTLCSCCDNPVNDTTSEMQFFKILSCGHVLCGSCWNLTSIHITNNLFPTKTCPVCKTEESFMVQPTVLKNIAYCALHKNQQAEFYCKECMRFLCSEKECEEHLTIRVKDIGSENKRLREEIDLFQSTIKELLEMDRAAKKSLSTFDRQADEIMNTFQVIIDTATKRVREVHKTIQAKRSMLTKKVDIISKSVSAVNRRFQTASALEEIARNSFPTSENLKGETYKLAAGGIFEKTLKISENFKSTSQQLQNYFRVTFEKDERVDSIVDNLKTLYTRYTVSNEVCSRDCEVPIQMNSSEQDPPILLPISPRQTKNLDSEGLKWYPPSSRPSTSTTPYFETIQYSQHREVAGHMNSVQVPSSNNANKITSILLPHSIASNCEIPNRLQSFSRPPTFCPRKSQTHDIGETKDYVPKLIPPYLYFEPEKRRKILEFSSIYENHKTLNTSDQTPLSKNAEMLTPMSLRQTINLNTERPTCYPPRRSKLCPILTISEKPSETPVKHQTVQLGKKRKLVESSNMMEEYMDRTCKEESLTQESGILAKYGEVGKVCGKTGTEFGEKQGIHISHLLSEQDHEESQFMKEEDIKTEPPDILDNEIKQEEHV